jgi:cAMP phosphodiesterase
MTYFAVPVYIFPQIAIFLLLTTNQTMQNENQTIWQEWHKCEALNKHYNHSLLWKNMKTIENIYRFKFT